MTPTTRHHQNLCQFGGPGILTDSRERTCLPSPRYFKRCWKSKDEERGTDIRSPAYKFEVTRRLRYLYVNFQSFTAKNLPGLWIRLEEQGERKSMRYKSSSSLQECASTHRGKYLLFVNYCSCAGVEEKMKGRWDGDLREYLCCFASLLRTFGCTVSFLKIHQISNTMWSSRETTDT